MYLVLVLLCWLESVIDFKCDARAIRSSRICNRSNNFDIFDYKWVFFSASAHRIESAWFASFGMCFVFNGQFMNGMTIERNERISMDLRTYIWEWRHSVHYVRWNKNQETAKKDKNKTELTISVWTQSLWIIENILIHW